MPGAACLARSEEASAEEVGSVFAVNVDGLLTVTRAVLPAMRSRRSGRILNISSVGGFGGWPGWGVYCATKFAVEGLSEALHAELLPLGISVTVIEPGTFRTDFLDPSSLRRAARVIDEYSGSGGSARNGRTRRITINLAIQSRAPPPSWPSLPARSRGYGCNGNRLSSEGRNKTRSVAGELAAWRKLAESTDYEQASNARSA